MDQKQDPPKEKSILDDCDCPACQNLEDIRPKRLYTKRLWAETKDSNNMMDTDVDDENYSKKKCYRCDDCNLNFKSSCNLEDHWDKNCPHKQIMLTGDVATYESCMDRLKSAIEKENFSFNAFQSARSETKDAVTHFAAVKTQKELDHKAYADAVARKKDLCTIVSAEEQLIMSDMVEQTSRKFKNSLNEEELASKAITQALIKLKNANHASTLAAVEVQEAFSEVIKAFRKQPMSTPSPPEVLHQELKLIREHLERNYNTLIELQQSAAELEASISVMLGVNSKKEFGGIENAGLNTSQVNKSGDKWTIVSDGKVPCHNVQADRMDATVESMDYSTPSTSGTH